MRKPFSFPGVALCAIAFASLAAAHEHDTFKIGDKYYLFTVGSLNEPFVVDSVSGVDFRVAQVAAPSGTHTSRSGTAVKGLEQTLKVEIGAGDKKTTLSFDPSDSAPGSYTASFIPTVQTSYTYRIFGKIDNNLVDFTFTCVAGEVSETAEDNSPTKVSDTVTRIQKIGAYACPSSKKTMGFPEPALSSYELSQNTQNVATAAQEAGKQAALAQTLGVVGLIAGLLGLILAGMVWKRK